MRGSRVPHRNRSPHGWWVAAYIERLQWDDEDPSDEDRRCLAWENTVLIKAKERNEAYRKALAVGKRGRPSRVSDRRGRSGAWVFEGLTMLLPIYDELADGEEIIWTEHAGKSVRTVRRMLKPRASLAVFNDKPSDAEITATGTKRVRKRPPRRTPASSAR